jgi:very-short-patch-repair endonuclease
VSENIQRPLSPNPSPPQTGERGDVPFLQAGERGDGISLQVGERGCVSSLQAGERGGMPSRGEGVADLPKKRNSSRKSRLTPVARKLRKNPTEAEKKLWALIRADQLGVRFRRQYPVGPYVVDFYCSSARLIIEADGGQHNENSSDMIRTAFLEGQGYRVLRFWNHDVLNNPEGVLERIREVLQR